MERIVTYNLCDNFIHKLADDIEEHYIRQGKDIARLAFVFGGRRPSFFLKRELSRRIKKSFMPPRFFSIEEFVEYTLEKRVRAGRISDLDACFLIYSLAKEIAPGMLKDKEAFSQFLPWVREISAFIEQLDLEDIGPASLKNIQSKAEIGFDVPDNINLLLLSIIALRDAYHQRLKDQGVYSRGLCYLSASQVAGQEKFDEFEQIFFCGFFYLHKTEQRILRVLFDAGKATLVFQGDAREWSVLKKVGDDFSAFPAQAHPPQKITMPVVQAAFDVHSQVCLVRQALKDIKNHEDTLIVLPDPANLIPLLSEISGQLGQYNVSMGYPLTRSSLYSLFACIIRAQETQKQGAYYSKDYLAALSHPLIKNLKLFKDPAVARVLVHKIEEALAGTQKSSFSGSIFVALAQIEHERALFDSCVQTAKSMDLQVSLDELTRGLALLHRVLFTSWETLSTLNEFSLALQELLRVLVDNSFLASYPLNVSMARELFKVQEELACARFNQERFTQNELFAIFENKLAHEMVSFAGSPLKGLQILGLFETRSLNFENVIIMDVNEAALPNLKIYEPLIPREVMISLGLNRLEKEEEIQRYQFRRLLASAKRALLVYQDSPDKEKSRFLEELLWQEQKSRHSMEAVSISRCAFNVHVLPKKLAVEKTPEVIAYLKKRTYSASSLNTYLHCPLRFYYQYVLGLEEKESVFEEPEAKDVGTFVHELLKEQYTRFLGVSPKIDARFEKEFFGAVDEKFNREFARKMKSDSFLMQEVLKFRLARFLDNEKLRRVKQVACLEEVFFGAAGTIECKAIVDRIDILDHGQALIVDYKTGGSDLMPQTDARKIELAGYSREALKTSLKSFQLPLYVHLVGQDARFKGMQINAALYFFKDFKQDFGMSRLFEDAQAAHAQEVMPLYLKAVEALYGQIIDPAVPFKADEEDERQCRYCPFFYLCR